MESDLDLVLAVERAKRRNRSSTRRRGPRWDRDLWTAYVVDGPRRFVGIPIARRPTADERSAAR